MKSEVAKRPPPPSAFPILVHARPEVRTITAIHEVNDDELTADIDGERYRIVTTLWGMIRQLGDDYVGMQLVPKKVGMHQWRYVPIRPSTGTHPARRA